MFCGLGFRVWGSDCRLWGFGFGVWGLGFRERAVVGERERERIQTTEPSTSAEKLNGLVFNVSLVQISQEATSQHAEDAIHKVHMEPVIHDAANDGRTICSMG